MDIHFPVQIYHVPPFCFTKPLNVEKSIFTCWPHRKRQPFQNVGKTLDFSWGNPNLHHTTTYDN
jgi:exonuclease III